MAVYVILLISTKLFFQGCSCNLMKMFFPLEKVSDDLRETRKTVTLHSTDKKPGYWTNIVKHINRVFVIFYLTTVTVFLSIMILLWNSAEDE